MVMPFRFRLCVEKYQLPVFARSLQTEKDWALKTFQNGGLIENQKFGRKIRSFFAKLEVKFVFSFSKCVSV